MNADMLNVILVLGGQAAAALWIVAGIRADIREAMVRIEALEKRVDRLESPA
jgi:hypothetical protein